jgi:putative pyruvate formate lyase activating enzyme
MQPLYIKTHRQGRLVEKIEYLNNLLGECRLCPRECKVNRLKDKKGFCGAGKMMRVSSVYAHFGEESCLVGRCGSGTIFFAYCNLKCSFCQNYEISHLAEGKEITPQDLSLAMLKLQKIGCHNINLVTPTHFTPQILEALKLAIESGLKLPLVYNCGGYESEEVVDILEGVIDIYMPDVKFSSSEAAGNFSQAPDYFSNLRKVLKKMHQQAGDLVITDGIAKRGLLVRHLVMPNGLAGTQEIMKYIALDLSKDTYVNIMAQYRPCGKAMQDSKIDRMISTQEYQEAMRICRSIGLHRFDK